MMLKSRSVRTAVWLLALCAAFAATHVPLPAASAHRLPSDKLLHFAGFAALGAVTSWRAGAGGRTPRPKTLMGWWGFLAAYAVIDELTQPLSGRMFEWADWAMDLCGAACSLLFLAVWRREGGR